MSFAALLFLLIYLAMFGVVYHEDEGTPAHLFQIWLSLEMIMILFFAVKWLPQKPKQASFIFLIQIIAVLAVCFPVFYFGF